ncbi:xylulokinase [Flavivirga spongiicola]|uniref:FGGY family carbohydrate kinase n=1 Tax=Flavivirga spongiicola TaxID=421621 RepID=A0ABU7XZ46_9FLAO|nr:FGGY family carbohydrate kinase [Flavivirga sp. MEBiC05379]MDO5980206.1 FGGY family carbohydrate kinase [Flavivirga sp. MEBiC05379]
MLFAGLDVSTQSCKLIVIDTQSNKVVFITQVNYDAELPEYNTLNGVIKNTEEGVSESNPLMWIEAIEKVFVRLVTSNIPQDKIKCISVSGQQHGLVSLQKNGELSHPVSKLWNDFSTQKECDYLTQAIGGKENMIKEIGNTQRTGYTASKILHLKNNYPQHYENTTTFLLVHNYINFYLTGGVATMEPGDVSGMALSHPEKNTWSEKIIQAIDPELKSKLPPIQASDKSIGFISKHLVQKYNFDPQCKIDAGCGDNMYGAIGTGNLEEGVITMSLGTSGTVYTFMDQPYVDKTGEISLFCNSLGSFMPLLCVSNLANGYNQFLEQENLTHDAFNQLVYKTKAGNNGKIIIPWFEGERTPDVPLATPTYFGFKLHEFNKIHLSRAIIEGAVLNLYQGFKRMPIKAKEIRLTGGLSKSPVWRQIIADIFNLDVLPVEGEGAALGAAIHAAWVWNKEKGKTTGIIETASPFIQLNEDERAKPIPENVLIYKHQKKLFNALSENLRKADNGDIFKIRGELL